MGEELGRYARQNPSGKTLGFAFSISAFRFAGADEMPGALEPEVPDAAIKTGNSVAFGKDILDLRQGIPSLVNDFVRYFRSYLERFDKAGVERADESSGACAYIVPKAYVIRDVH